MNDLLKYYEEFYALLEQQNVALVKLKWAVGDKLLELRQIEMVKPPSPGDCVQNDTGYAGNLRDWIKACHLPGDKIRSIKELRDLTKWDLRLAKNAVELVLGVANPKWFDFPETWSEINAFDAKWTDENKAKGT